MPGRVPASYGSLVGNRNGSILRSVGSNSMSLLVLCLRQGWHVVCQHVRDFCFWFGVFWAFWFLLGVLCTWGVLVLLGSLLCTRLGLLRCASCWTRPLGGSRWGHYLCNLWGEYLKVHKTAYKYFGIHVLFFDVGAIFASLSGTAQSPWL